MISRFPYKNKALGVLRTEGFIFRMQKLETEGDSMARKVADRKSVKIIFDQGETFVESANLNAYYRYKRWFIHINPAFLLPGFRKDHRKKIYVNGKRYGFAEYNHGCIPLYPPLDDAPGLGFKIMNYIRIHFGLCCRRLDRGYFRVRLGTQEYVVLRRYTKERNVLCYVYYRPTNELLGSFIFDKDFNNVYPRWSVNDWVYSMYVIIGYVADAIIYASVAQQLNRRINVVIS